jgi:hypothetical protein
MRLFTKETIEATFVMVRTSHDGFAARRRGQGKRKGL